MTTRNCQKCGKLMHFKGGNHRYCNTCKPSKKYFHFCVRCGFLITNYKGYGQKYCDSCRAEARKEQDRLRKKEQAMNKPYFCVNCGEIIHNYNGHGQKYCKVCSVVINRELTRLRFLRYYNRWRGSMSWSMGTGGLSGSANPDPDMEYNSVRNELKRLGLKYRSW